MLTRSFCVPPAERERGITIDIALWKFDTPKLYVTVTALSLKSVTLFVPANATTDLLGNYNSAASLTVANAYTSTAQALSVAATAVSAVSASASGASAVASASSSMVGSLSVSTGAGGASATGGTLGAMGTGVILAMAGHLQIFSLTAGLKVNVPPVFN